MIKSLIAAAVAGALALPLAAQASALGDNLVVAQAGGSASGSPAAAERGAAGNSAPNFDGRDRNRDGFISRDEARDATELQTRFTELDLNNDGKLTREEYDVVNRGATGSSAGSTGTMRSPSSMSGSGATK